MLRTNGRTSSIVPLRRRERIRGPFWLVGGGGLIPEFEVHLCVLSQITLLADLFSPVLQIELDARADTRATLLSPVQAGVDADGLIEDDEDPYSPVTKCR